MAAPTDAPAPAVTETSTTQPVVTTTTTTSPPLAEPTPPPEPVVTTTTTVPARLPVVTLPTPAPVVDAPTGVGGTPVTVDTKKVGPPAPTAGTDNDGTAHASTPADACHMDSYEATPVDSRTDPGEVARADKVDRNGNGIVCRKDIPGRGRGNTGDGSNIKDDQAG